MRPVCTWDHAGAARAIVRSSEIVVLRAMSIPLSPDIAPGVGAERCAMCRRENRSWNLNGITI